MIIDIRTLSPVAKVGVVISMISLLLWLTLAVIPFLPMAGKPKAFWALVVFIAAEVTFYLGLALVGKEVVQRVRDRFKRKRQDDTATLPADSLEPLKEDET